LIAALVGTCSLMVSATGLHAAERIVFVGHWSESDSFFNVIRNSAQLAADQLGVTLEFRNPSGGDLSEMGRLVDQAIASKPDGLISTVPDETIVGTALSNAVASGIPVVIVNSGSPEIAKKLGALRYIGHRGSRRGVRLTMPSPMAWRAGAASVLHGGTALCRRGDAEPLYAELRRAA
jgi:simple sugar transport system substrate-binding protein